MRDVHLHEDRDGILLTGLQERGDATPEKLAFAHWTPLEGWKAGGVIPTYPESGRGRATTKVAIRADDAGRHYILVVSGDPSQTSYRDPVASRAAVIRETEGGWYRAGAIALDIESSGRGVDMVLSGDRLYILYHSNGQLYSHHASLSAPDLSFIEHSIQVDDYIIAGAQADQPGVIRGVIEIDGFTHLLRGDSAGLHPGGILPISDLISWLFSIGDQPLVISGSGDYRAQIAMEVPKSTRRYRIL